MKNENLLRIEKCNSETLSGSFGALHIPHNYVFYFERENNVEFNLYIRQNIESIKEDFKSVGKNFVYLPLVQDVQVELSSILEYYCPQLALNGLAQSISKEFSEINIALIIHDLSNFISECHGGERTFKYGYESLLRYLGCTNDVNSGLVVLEFGTYLIEPSKNSMHLDNVNYDLFFSEVIKFIQTLKSHYDDISLCPKIEISSEKIDDESREVIKDLEEKLQSLKDGGQLLFLIPLLRDVLDRQSKNIDVNKISKIQVDSNYRIWLPDFSKEVGLSHLTKAVYILFLKHPEGFNLKDLVCHKKELLNIYTSVSNQLDYDKMIKSVEDVINVETKAIYTHISRIKSAFYKILDESFARYYIVSGSGEEERKILVHPDSVEWTEVNELDDFVL